MVLVFRVLPCHSVAKNRNGPSKILLSGFPRRTETSAHYTTTTSNHRVVTEQNGGRRFEYEYRCTEYEYETGGAVRGNSLSAQRLGRSRALPGLQPSIFPDIQRQKRRQATFFYRNTTPTTVLVFRVLPCHSVSFRGEKTAVDPLRFYSQASLAELKHQPTTPQQPQIIA